MTVVQPSVSKVCNGTVDTDEARCEELLRVGCVARRPVQ